jgi:uncharacterized membrane protein
MANIFVLAVADVIETPPSWAVLLGAVVCLVAVIVLLGRPFTKQWSPRRIGRSAAIGVMAVPIAIALAVMAVIVAFAIGVALGPCLPLAACMSP